MVRGVLFDLDNTLVTIDVDAFVEAYSEAMARAVLPGEAERGLAVMMGASYRLLSVPDAPETNRERLLGALAADLGLPAEELWQRIETASAAILPGLSRLAAPIPGAAWAVREARARGLRVALATNPIYPRSVVVGRMAWAGLDARDVDVIACLEECRSTKPHPAHFRELAAALGLGPDQCLMVGDDPDQDLPARATGMAVHMVGDQGSRHVGDGVRAGPVAGLFHVWQDQLPAAS